MSKFLRSKAVTYTSKVVGPIVSKTVLDRDIVTTAHKQEVIDAIYLIASMPSVYVKVVCRLVENAPEGVWRLKRSPRPSSGNEGAYF